MNLQRKNLVLLLSLVAFSISAVGQEESEEIVTLGKQVLVDEGAFILQENVTISKAHENFIVYLQEQFMYGLTDRVSIEIIIPVFLKNKIGNAVSYGLSDISAELGAQIYKADHNSILLIGGIYVPTGNARKFPALGNGTFNIYAGYSFIHDSETLYADAEIDMIFESKRLDFETANVFSYEFTLGPRIDLSKNSSKSVWYITGLLQGSYEGRSQNRVNVINEGGHILFLGPFISWQNDFLFLQASFLFPVSQYLFENQPHFQYVFSFNLCSYFG